MQRSKIMQAATGFFFFSCGIFFFGCEPSSTRDNPLDDNAKYLLKRESQSISSNEIEFVPVVTPKSGNPYQGKKPSQLTDAERKSLEQEIKEVGKAQFALRVIAMHEPQWQDADKKVKSILQSVEKYHLSHTVEQFAGSLMLRRLLANNETGVDKQETMSFYAKMLLRHHHPDSDLIAQALVALEGYWSEEEISHHAKETAKNAREYLARNPCQPCLEKAGVKEGKEKLLDAQQRKLYRMHQALSALDKKTKARS